MVQRPVHARQDRGVGLENNGDLVIAAADRAGCHHAGTLGQVDLHHGSRRQRPAARECGSRSRKAGQLGLGRGSPLRPECDRFASSGDAFVIPPLAHVGAHVAKEPFDLGTQRFSLPADIARSAQHIAAGAAGAVGNIDHALH